jgi:hypothetical protein
MQTWGRTEQSAYRPKSVECLLAPDEVGWVVAIDQCPALMLCRPRKRTTSRTGAALPDALNSSRQKKSDLLTLDVLAKCFSKHTNAACSHRDLLHHAKVHIETADF